MTGMSATAPVTDHDLLEAARGGDAQALEQLLERYQSRIYRFGLKMCRDSEDARDVVQDTLLAAARSLRDFRGASSLSTWLYTITRSFCIKKRRRSKFAPEAEVSLDSEAGPEALAAADPGRGPDELAASREIEEALERAIRALPPAQREILMLRDVEGLTAPEVAEVTGLKVEAVKSRLHRARTALRAQLGPLLGLARDHGPASPACPDVFTALERHLDDELSPETCAEIERHLGGCRRCQGVCDSLKRTLRLCQAAPAPAVPGDLQKAIRSSIRKLLDEGR